MSFIGCSGRDDISGNNVICDSDWKCKDNKTLAYQNSDCSWERMQKCNHRCSSGVCVSKNVDQTYYSSNMIGILWLNNSEKLTLYFDFKTIDVMPVINKETPSVDLVWDQLHSGYLKKGDSYKYDLDYNVKITVSDFRFNESKDSVLILVDVTPPRKK